MNSNLKTKLTALIALLFVTSIFVGCKKDDDTPVPANTAPDTLSCSITASTVLMNDPDKPVDYIVPCVVGVEANLTIQAGTVIEFQPDAGLQVYGNGEISSIGSAIDPIIMRGTNQTKGSWRGIYVESQSANNVVEYTTIRHAGGNSFNSNDDRGTIVLYSGGSLALRNSTLEMGEEFGLNANYENTDLSFANNTITTHSKAPIRISALHVDELDVNSSLSGNTENFIRVYDGTFDENETWSALSVPYRFIPQGNYPYISIPQNIVWTLNAGVELQMGAGTAIQVEGAMAANGTTGEPVVLTGATATPGSWTGIQVYSADVRTDLDHVEIAYAGGNPFSMQASAGAVVLYLDAYASVTNSLIRDGQAPCGINVVAPGNNEVLITTGTTFQNITTDICQ